MAGKKKKITKEKERQLQKPFDVRFMDGFKILTRQHNPHEVWRDVFELYALSIHNPLTKNLYSGNEKLEGLWNEREERYMHKIGKYSKKEVSIITQMLALFAMELCRKPYQDLAGELYMKLELGNSNLGQVFTPYSLAKASTGLTVNHEHLRDTVRDKGWYAAYDPACGGGAMLIAFAEKCDSEFKRLEYRNHLLIVANDIDPLCWHMCYVQLSLLGVAAIVTLSDALVTPKVDFYETPELVLFTPTYLNDVWSYRRLFHGLDLNMDRARYGLFGGGSDG